MKAENELYRVELDRRNGVIRRVLDKAGGMDLIGEPRLAENFRLLLPLPGLHANYICGVEQDPPAIERTPEGLLLHWDGPLRNAHGKFNLDVTMRIEFVGGAIHFPIAVRNGTPHRLAEVWYPILGGFKGLGEGEARLETQALVPHGFTQRTGQLLRDFQPAGESLGCLCPEQAFSYPGHMPMPWCSFYHGGLGRGFYFASHDPLPRARALRFTMAPGAATGRVGTSWPTAAERGEMPAGITMNWAFFPYAKPGETFEGAPVVLQCHEGDWRRSAALYREWFTARFPLVDSRKHWLRRATEFMNTMFMLPEDNVNFTYADIPAWAKTAADFGLKSVQISGWQVGGHDRGYPHYEPEPRLGTWEELEAGVRACHQMGLRVYFFANVQPADITTEWYRKELHRYIIMDLWGNPVYYHGWGMGTLGARMGLTRVNSTDMNPAHPEVRDIIVRQITKLAQIGADGVHLDKLFAHPLDFNPRLEGGPDLAMHEGILRCVEELLEACRRINPEFCLSYENNWDRLMSYSDVCWWGTGLSVMKEVFPQWAATTGITQPWAFNLVNAAVLGGHFIMVGPAYYTRAMDYEPMQALCAYVAEVARIRGELHEVLSRGRIVAASAEPFARAEPVVNVTGPFAQAPDARWTVFQDVDTGRRAAVLGNLGVEPLEARVEFEGRAGREALLYQPFEEVRRAAEPARLLIPSERIAVMVES